jgi:hypothetical protein
VKYLNFPFLKFPYCLFISVLFSRRKRASRKSCGQGERPDTVEEVRHRKPFITNPSLHIKDNSNQL